MQIPLLPRNDLTDCSAEIVAYGGDESFLRTPKRIRSSNEPITGIDLFSGIGGLSLGIEAAALDLGFDFKPIAAFENNVEAATVYGDNFGCRAFQDNILTYFNRFDATLSQFESAFQRKTVDFLLAGPPCQGHSDLNNYTRRGDARNELYYVVARAAQVFSPTHVIIENVPGARHDRSKVVQKTIDALQKLHYSVSCLLLDAFDFGVAQNRRRLFIIASKHVMADRHDLMRRFRCEARNLDFAISDLQGLTNRCIISETPGETRALNKKRIDFLFDNELFDLPDEMRPECHRYGGHTYRSVYGRLSWHKPSQTITRGFHSISMGRYIHPSERRTITAHEAARIQFLPDFFDFSAIKSRSSLADVIGNAVPPKMGFVLAKYLLENCDFR